MKTGVAMSEPVDVAYLKKRLARLKHDLANWAALEQSYKEAIQESRTPQDKAAARPNCAASRRRSPT
jgi:hypothetical protein